jgi:hypothetical protein
MPQQTAPSASLAATSLPRPRLASGLQGVLLQAESTYETRAIRKACMLLDGVTAIGATIGGIQLHAESLQGGCLMPVGSVEFVRAAMAAGGIAEPTPIGFPPALTPFLHRQVRQVAAIDVAGRWFVKPVATKLFNGFVFDATGPSPQMDAHDREQREAFLALPGDAAVWISDPVRFVSEWRFYVLGGQVAGSGRYDADGADDAPVPDFTIVKQAIAALTLSAPYALDVGVLDTGETAVVEANPAWAIGLYADALDARTYYRFLREFWDSLFV